ncbi:signal peptidase I [Candidatus Woesearchaeota archaeon]|nr:signal peptidase I [Candidatus Woesearchaeota archaeon]
MEHNAGFDQWWQENRVWYEEKNIDENDFIKFKNGFDKGDMMVLLGKEPNEIKVGDVIVYSVSYSANPIIHRVVSIKADEKYFFETKGDNNLGQLPFEKEIAQEQLLGKAVLRVPLLGWVKVLFTDFVNLWR